MASHLQEYSVALHEAFWKESFWLPYNHTWTDILEHSPGAYQSLSLLTCIMLVTVLCISRILVTYLIFIPLGSSFGLKPEKRKKKQMNDLLNEAFSKTQHPSGDMLKKLSISSGMDEKSIECWFRRRRRMTKIPVLNKFYDSGWKFCFYAVVLSYGLYALHDKNYLYNIEDVMMDYPRYVLPEEIRWYYLIELSFYISESINMYYGIRRSDFYVLFLHHLTTIALITFSYVSNFHRIGAIILLIHDVGDCWLECAKMLKYAGKHKIAESLFIIFILIWIVTRLTYFPFWVIYTAWQYFPNPSYPAYTIQFCSLLVLQCMHIYWFYLIMCTAVRVKTMGEAAQDYRSESEASDTSLTSDEGIVDKQPSTYQRNGMLLSNNDVSQKICKRKS